MTHGIFFYIYPCTRIQGFYHIFSKTTIPSHVLFYMCSNISVPKHVLDNMCFVPREIAKSI